MSYAGPVFVAGRYAGLSDDVPAPAERESDRTPVETVVAASTSGSDNTTSRGDRS